MKCTSFDGYQTCTACFVRNRKHRVSSYRRNKWCTLADHQPIVQSEQRTRCFALRTVKWCSFAACHSIVPAVTDKNEFCVAYGQVLYSLANHHPIIPSATSANTFCGVAIQLSSSVFYTRVVSQISALLLVIASDLLWCGVREH